MLEVLPDQLTVLEELKSLLPGFRAAVISAKERYEREPVDNRTLHTATTTASSMVNYMVAEAKLGFGSEPRVSFLDDEETWLVVDQKYDVRFKKLSEVGQPQNTETTRQRQITSQWPLPGFHLIRLNLGWRGEIPGNFEVLLSFNNGSVRSVGWCVELRTDGAYDLFGDAILPFDDGLPLFRPPADPFDLSEPYPADQTKRRVRPRTVPVTPDEAAPTRVKPAASPPPLGAEEISKTRKDD